MVLNKDLPNLSLLIFKTEWGDFFPFLVRCEIYANTYFCYVITLKRSRTCTLNFKLDPLSLDLKRGVLYYIVYIIYRFLSAIDVCMSKMNAMF